MLGHVTWVLLAAVVYLGTECRSSELTVRSMLLRSHIKYRFATIVVTSTVVNDDANRSHEALFHVNLPEEAFISNFSMTVDGEVYPGRVEEKKKAMEEYQEAKSLGQSAGYIKTTARHSNKFDVSVNLKPGSLVSFNLTYQQVLVRCHGKYEHRMHVNPGRVVRDLKVEVFLEEARNIIEIDTSLKKDLNDNTLGENDVRVDTVSPSSRYIVYNPSQEEQRLVGRNGISGEFLVKYDVERTSPAGEVLIVDGYFLHFFAPENSGDRPPVPKDIVFVLDVSGSMTGTKIQQLKDAMGTILRELSSDDRFTIVLFSDRLNWWKTRLVPVNSDSLKMALQYVNSIVPNDSTDINSAMIGAVEFLLNNRNRNHTSIVFFLTDGEPTTGVKDPRTIANNVERNNENVASVFGLAFGQGADYNLIKIISVQNNGFARRIYEAADASKQVKGFYDEISSTMMLNLSISYLNKTVQEDTLTTTYFRNIFKGNDVVVAGKVDPSVLLSNAITGIITAETTQGTVNIVLDNETKGLFLTPDPQENPYFQMPVDFAAVTEKSWAYLTIKDLLAKKKKEAYKKTNVSEIDDQILKLSKKYNFVTPLTSMVATKPEAKSTSANIQGDDYAPEPPTHSYKTQPSGSHSRKHRTKSVVPSASLAYQTSYYMGRNFHHKRPQSNAHNSRAMGVQGSGHAGLYDAPYMRPVSFGAAGTYNQNPPPNVFNIKSAAGPNNRNPPSRVAKYNRRNKSRARNSKRGRKGKAKKSHRTKTCRIVKTILHGFGTETNGVTKCVKPRGIVPGSYRLYPKGGHSTDSFMATFTGSLQKPHLDYISSFTNGTVRTYTVSFDSHHINSSTWESKDRIMKIIKTVNCNGRRGVAKIFVVLRVPDTHSGVISKRDVKRRSKKKSVHRGKKRKNSMFRICKGRPLKETLTKQSTRYWDNPPQFDPIADTSYKI